MIRSIARVAIMALAATGAAAIGACRGSSSPPESTEQAKAAVPGNPSAAPGQPVNADAQALAGLVNKVNEYAALHQKLENSLPKLSKESTPVEIDKHQRALAKLIQDARRDAKPGDLFTPEAQAIIKKMLAKVFEGPDGPGLKASIMDENPGVPGLKVNDRYPDTVPVSTVPPQVLQGLPKLPEEMEFRFVGNDLILMDTHAHIIADVIKDAFAR